MDDKPVEQLKINILDLSGRGAAVKVFTCESAKKKTRPRGHKKPHTFARRSDFATHLGYLGKQKAADLAQLRDEIQEAIERVVRVHGAFARALAPCAIQSERVKHVIRVVGEVPFHCELQEIIELNHVRAKRIRDAAEDARQELKRRRKETIRALGLNIKE